MFKTFACAIISITLCPALIHSQTDDVEIVSHVAKNPAEVPPRITRSKPETVTIDLVAREVIAEISPGKKFVFWTFAEKKSGAVGPGTVPGPMIRVMEGDTVVINLTNDLHNEAAHNLDFHSGFGAMLEDLAPGETGTLTFKARREGAYIYHCGAEGKPWEHVAYGMYGLMMVEPAGGLSKVDREFYLGQSEWYMKPGIEDHPDIEGYSLDEEKAMAERPDCFTFNGHTSALASPSMYGNAVTASKGDKVRIFFVAGGPNLGSNFHIIGLIFDRVYPGHHDDYIRNEETVHVPPGSAVVIELKALEQGDFVIVDHALYRVARGAKGILRVTSDSRKD
jgi:nitrite reductase (NO-forming)